MRDEHVFAEGGDRECSELAEVVVGERIVDEQLVVGRGAEEERRLVRDKEVDLGGFLGHP